MSNYIEYKDKVAFHPGYYIKEIIEESGLTQEDFARRLDTTPKNLSYIVRGEQTLSIDIAMKLSRMLGTSVNYWLNLQKTYDSLIANFQSDEELVHERSVFEYIDYSYFRIHFGLPDLRRKVDEQIKQVREFLNVSTLNVLKDRNLAISFRSCAQDMSISNVVNANAMVQIAINKTLRVNAPKYNKKQFLEAVDYALTLTTKHGEFFPLIKRAFWEAGVVLVVLPNLKNSGINGASKKVGQNVMLMVNDRRAYSDTFWFTLFHEIGHIIHGDYGITLAHETKDKEDAADLYAQNTLIPAEQYAKFIANNRFDLETICAFAKKIGRDPGIVLGRLQNDGKVAFNNTTLSKALRHKYKVIIK